MAVPEQIRKQSEAVARLYEDLNPESPASEEVEQTQEESSVVDAADNDEESDQQPESNERGQSGTNDETAYEHRYRTLQGMYNADTARLRAENQQLNERLNSMEELLSSMSTQSTVSSEQPAEVTKLITDNDLEEYGDSIDVMRRVTREEVSSVSQKIADMERMLQQLQTSVVPRVEQVAHRQAASAEQAFWSDLTRAVPAWKEINDNPQFHEWLLEVDPLSGMSRQDYLASAQQNLDANRVAAFFSTWESQNGQASAQPNRTASDELQKQVAPGKGRSGGSAAQGSNVKTYSPADIKKFFDDVRKGVYKGREAERDKIERDIFAAQGEGRIVMNG